MPYLLSVCVAVGLVYKHFGKELIANMMKLPLDHPDVQTVYLQVYKNFIESVDAIDNGVNQYDTDAPARLVVGNKHWMINHIPLNAGQQC